MPIYICTRLLSILTNICHSGDCKWYVCVVFVLYFPDERYSGKCFMNKLKQVRRLHSRLCDGRERPNFSLILNLLKQRSGGVFDAGELLEADCRRLGGKSIKGMCQAHSVPLKLALSSPVTGLPVLSLPQSLGESCQVLEKAC